MPSELRNILFIAAFVVFFFDILYVAYYAIKWKSVTIPLSTLELIKWWKIQQNVFKFFIICNCLVLAFLSMGLMATHFGMDVFAFFPVFVVGSGILLSILEAPYQTILRTKVILYLRENNNVPDSFIENAAFASVLPEDVLKGGPFEAARDIGFIKISKQTLTFV